MAETFLARCRVAGGEGNEDEGWEVDGEDLVVELLDLGYPKARSPTGRKAPAPSQLT